MQTHQQNKREEVRKKIIEAVPSILDLKFGCEVIIDKGFKRTVFLNEFRDDEDCDRISHILTEADRIGMVQLSPVESLVEIIGRPIQLADVLIAINKNHEWGIGLNPGMHFEVHSAFDVNVSKCSWNLSLDFDHQSDQIIDFLHELLS